MLIGDNLIPIQRSVKNLGLVKDGNLRLGTQFVDL